MVFRRRSASGLFLGTRITVNARELTWIGPQADGGKLTKNLRKFAIIRVQNKVTSWHRRRCSVSTALIIYPQMLDRCYTDFHLFQICLTSVDYFFSTEDTDKHGFLFCVFCVFCGLSFSHGWSRMWSNENDNDNENFVRLNPFKFRWWCFIRRC